MNCDCHDSVLCFKHKMDYWRDGNLQVSPTATPNRRNQAGPKVRESANAWERGTPTDQRGMPFLGKDLKPLGIKAFTEQRRAFEDRKHAHHTTHTP